MQLSEFFLKEYHSDQYSSELSSSLKIHLRDHFDFMLVFILHENVYQISKWCKFSPSVSDWKFCVSYWSEKYVSNISKTNKHSPKANRKVNMYHMEKVEKRGERRKQIPYPNMYVYRWKRRICHVNAMKISFGDKYLFERGFFCVW